MEAIIATLPGTVETPVKPISRLSEFTSLKFRFWAFVSMVMLVFVHGYNMNERYLQPWTLTFEPLSPTGFVEYLLANGLFRFRIPMLFAISGYLFAMHDRVPHGRRMVKRLRTLGLPYLIWSAIGLAMFYVLELFPGGREMVADSHMAQIDQNRVFVHQYQWWEVLTRWTLNPVNYQLWFIRVLLVYNLLYPVIRWCVTNRVAKWIFFTVAVLAWLATMGLHFIEGEGLLFFGLGVWLQKKNFNIESPKPWLKPSRWVAVFLAAAIIKTWLAFQGPHLADSLMTGKSGEQKEWTLGITMMLLHKITIASGLVTAWFGGDALVRWAMKRQWFIWITAFSFMIYALHAPLVAMLINPVHRLLDHLPFYRILTFILLPTFMIACSIAIGATLRRFTPRVYGVLTGGRGM